MSSDPQDFPAPGEPRARLRQPSAASGVNAVNDFRPDFIMKIGQEVVYIMATRQPRELIGGDWEKIFANAINAAWQPSNVGLYDVAHGQHGWSAKTIKSPNPHAQKKVRLISGRNSPAFSYDAKIELKEKTQEIGRMVLEIWNQRVSDAKKNYPKLRTVVLIKSNDLKKLTIFEFETQTYDPSNVHWKLNKKGNIEGFTQEAAGLVHRFTWQQHGSQFTIIEDVPVDSLRLTIKEPPPLDKYFYLQGIGFDEKWVVEEKK